MQFNFAIAAAILAYTAAAAPGADSCVKQFSVCKAQAGTDGARNLACDNNRAQCINQCNIDSAGAELTACTGLSKEESTKPQTAIARDLTCDVENSCTKKFSVCKAQAGTDVDRNAKCTTDRADCFKVCNSACFGAQLSACTGVRKDLSGEPQTAVARDVPAESCVKKFSVCKAQAGTDSERNAACDNNRAQCINQCNVNSAGAELTACTGLSKEESSKPQTAVARDVPAESCVKKFSVCKAQAGTDGERNAACDNNRAQCINQCNVNSAGAELTACTGLSKEESSKPQTAVARDVPAVSCVKAFSVCKAQAGTDGERNAACDNNRAQCINKCNVESAGAELTACTGLSKEESSKPQTAVL